MATINLSARPYRVEVANASQSAWIELAIAWAELNQDAYQYSQYPQRELSTLVHGVNAPSGLVDYSQSINPAIGPEFFSFGNRVRLSVQKTNGNWVQLFVGPITRMKFRDGRQPMGSAAQRNHPSLLLTVLDEIGATAIIDYPQDLSQVTIGTARSVRSVVNNMLSGVGLTEVLATDTVSDASTSAPLPYNPNEARSVVDQAHQITWANPTAQLTPSYLYSDAAGNSRIGQLSLSPNAFLFDGNADELPEFIDSDAVAEIPPRTISITGQIDRVIDNTESNSVSTTRSDITVPVEPRVIQPQSGDTPAVLEPTQTFSNRTTSRVTTTTRIASTGNVLFAPEIVTTTDEQQIGALIYRKHPEDIQEELGLTSPPSSFRRKSTTLINLNRTINRKIYSGPSDRLSEERTVKTGLSVQADENDTSSSQIQIENRVVTYNYNLRGIVTSRTTVTRQPRGLADSTTTKDEDRLEIVLSEEIIEKWEPLAFSGDTDRYTYSRTVHRPFDANDSTTESVNPESQPPQTDFFPGEKEVRPEDVSCDFDFIYGANGVARTRTIDYGSSIFSRATCRDSAEIEARLINGQTYAKNIKFSLTDDVIDKLWPSTGRFDPYIRVVDSENGGTFVYLADQIRIRAEKDQLYGECYAIFLSVNTDANPTIADTLVSLSPQVRIRASNNIRILPGGGVRVPA